MQFKLILIPERILFQDKMQQPDRPDKQKPQVIKKGWFFTFYFMADELAYPGNNKNEQANQP